MKQIVINADPETHEWVKGLAQSEKRTMGNQVLALLGIIRNTAATPAPKPRTTKKGVKA